jgi:ribonuclease HI
MKAYFFSLGMTKSFQWGARCRGIIMDPGDDDPGGPSRTYFAWGLGIASNNRAGAYALWQGLKVAKGMGVQYLIVIGDSKTIISHMVHNSEPGDCPLASILDWSRQETNSFISITYYHVLRDLC